MNPDFVRKTVGKSRIASAVVLRTPNSFPLGDGFRAVAAAELAWP